MSRFFLNLFLRRFHYLAHLPNLFGPLTTMKPILVACLTSTFSYIFNTYSHDYTNTNLKLTCLHLWLLNSNSPNLLRQRLLSCLNFSLTPLQIFLHIFWFYVFEFLLTWLPIFFWHQLLRCNQLRLSCLSLSLKVSLFKICHTHVQPFRAGHVLKYRRASFKTLQGEF